MSLQRSLPGVQIVAQWTKIMQRFVVTDYDAANADKANDTLYKSALQRCQLRGLDFDAEVCKLANDDIPAAAFAVDPEIEELVELAMQAREAEIAAGIFHTRVDTARAARAMELEGIHAREAEEAARKGRRGRQKKAQVAPAKACADAARDAPGRRKPPVVDELKLLNQLCKTGAWLWRAYSGWHCSHACVYACWCVNVGLR